MANKNVLLSQTLLHYLVVYSYLKGLYGIYSLNTTTTTMFGKLQMTEVLFWYFAVNILPFAYLTLLCFVI